MKKFCLVIVAIEVTMGLRGKPETMAEVR